MSDDFDSRDETVPGDCSVIDFPGNQLTGDHLTAWSPRLILAG